MQQGASDTIRHLAEPTVPVASATRGAELYDRFSRDSDLLALPVVDNGRPVGLVNRHALLVKLADRFGRALFEKKAASYLMDATPLIVDANLALDDLSSTILLVRPSALLTGFIVTEDGRYLGVGTAL